MNSIKNIVSGLKKLARKGAFGLCALACLVLAVALFASMLTIKSLLLTQTMRISIVAFTNTILGAGCALSWQKYSLDKKVELSMLSRDELEERNIAMDKQHEFDKSENERLKTELALSKCSQFSIADLKKIFEVSLLSIPMTWPLVRKEPIESKKCKGIIADETVTESLIIQAKQVTVKIGFDLSELKIEEKDGGYIVSGIKPKYNGFCDPQTTPVLSEIRRTTTKDGKRKTKILNNEQILIDELNKAQHEWEEKLSKGLEFSCLNENVKQLGENFVKCFLIPGNKAVQFIEDETPCCDFELA